MKNSLKKIIYISIFSAISFVLFMFPKFPLIPAFPWLEADFSEIPAFFAASLMGPAAGFAVVLIKNVIHLAVTTTGMVGELSNFLLGAAFVLSFGIFYKYVLKFKNNFAKIVLSVVIAAFFQIITAVLVNYFIMVPLYMGEGFDAINYIIAGVIPFNAVKDAIVAAAFIIVYKVLGNTLNRLVNK